MPSSAISVPIGFMAALLPQVIEEPFCLVGVVLGLRGVAELPVRCREELVRVGPVGADRLRLLKSIEGLLRLLKRQAAAREHDPVLGAATQFGYALQELGGRRYVAGA